MLIISFQGGTSIYKPYSAVSPQRVGFLRRFGLKTGIDFVHFGPESGNGSRGHYGSVRTYLLFQFQMKTEKDRVIYEFEVDFKKSFIWRPHLSNDERPGLKTGMDFRVLVWKRVWKMTFLVWNSGKDLENRAPPLPLPHQEFLGVLSGNFVMFSHLVLKDTGR